LEFAFQFRAAAQVLGRLAADFNASCRAAGLIQEFLDARTQRTAFFFLCLDFLASIAERFSSGSGARVNDVAPMC
jgi:hypothetical protein